jgi:nucleotide-binding universal stress UspA family protein
MAVKYAADRAEAAGLEVEGIIAEGHPAEEIMKYAEKNSFDLIVMGTLGKSGLDRFLMGSVADKVIRNSRIPVIVVPVKEEQMEL